MGQLYSRGSKYLMHTQIADKLGCGRSAIHRIDARWKVVATVALVITTVAVPLAYWPAYLVLGGLAMGLYAVSRLPVGYLLKRLAVAMPLVVLVAAGAPLSRGLDGGFAFAAQIVIRALLALTFMVTLVGTTPYDKLLGALERLGMPRTLIWVLAFMYRYMFVLVDELARMRQAKAARSFRRNWWMELQVMGDFVGVLFVRAFERAERVYAAMCARGWSRDQALDEERRVRSEGKSEHPASSIQHPASSIH
jgi:cobalt/nickel transport system permease protein